MREYDAIVVGGSFAGLAVARRRVLRHRAGYRMLAWAQRGVRRMPRSWLGPMARLANRPAVRRHWWPAYVRFGSEGTISSVARLRLPDRADGARRIVR